MSRDLLRDSVPAVTRAYAKLWDSYGRHADLIDQIRFIGLTDTPDDWVPWFIWDFGLEDAVPYVRDYRRVLAEGPEWQRTRGTPRGIQIGIGWVESAGVVAPSDQRHSWWEFQVGFEWPASDTDQIRQLDGIIRLSKASEDELFRMFSPGRDHRPVRMDMHRADHGLMDGYSGDALWEGGPLISFGWTGSQEVSAENVVEASSEILVSIEINRTDGYRMDVDRFGGVAAAQLEASAEIDVTNETDAFAADSWPTAWPNSWAEAARPRLSSSSWDIT